jgi:hypothetical protein
MMEHDMIVNFMRDARIYFGLDRQGLAEPQPPVPAQAQSDATESLQRQTTNEE